MEKCPHCGKEAINKEGPMPCGTLDDLKPLKEGEEFKPAYYANQFRCPDGHLWTVHVGENQHEQVSVNSLLASVETDLNPIREQLVALSAKYRDGGEDRIGWEILNSVRCIDQTIELAKVYLSGTPLPTLSEMREMFAENK